MKKPMRIGKKYTPLKPMSNVPFAHRNVTSSALSIGVVDESKYERVSPSTSLPPEAQMQPNTSDQKMNVDLKNGEPKICRMIEKKMHAKARPTYSGEPKASCTSPF